jgi:prepilin-type N-terminal cleavage/methylation domain-containing protein
MVLYLSIRIVSMKSKIIKKLSNPRGFTIVETLIALAIAGLIMVIVFIAISEAQVSIRDSHRKAYARTVFQALEEFNKNNGKFPGCVRGCDTSDMQIFMEVYIPEGTDPSTGESYRSTPTKITNIGTSGTGISSANGSAVYYDNGVHHDLIPEVGQIYIATAHWCYSSAPDSGEGPPLAGYLGDNDVTKFALVIYLEHGGYYCIDNYGQG